MKGLDRVRSRQLQGLAVGPACGQQPVVGLIAQLAERVADNDEVPGSSPGGPIRTSHIQRFT